MVKITPISGTHEYGHTKRYSVIRFRPISYSIEDVATYPYDFRDYMRYSMDLRFTGIENFLEVYIYD